LECIPSTELKGLEKPIIPVFKPNLPCYLCNCRVYQVQRLSWAVPAFSMDTPRITEKEDDTTNEVSGSVTFVKSVGLTPLCFDKLFTYLWTSPRIHMVAIIYNYFRFSDYKKSGFKDVKHTQLAQSSQEIKNPFAKSS